MNGKNQLIKKFDIKKSFISSVITFREVSVSFVCKESKQKLVKRLIKRLSC